MFVFRHLSTWHVSIICFYIIPVIMEATEDKTITIATYNLWNIMFNWDVRKLRIAQMIKQTGPDVIAFQEVRSDRFSSQNQVAQLQELLPLYKWMVYESANDIIPLEHVYKTGWEKEGIGILSKLPIVNHTTHKLIYRQGPDRNHRIILHTVVDGAAMGQLNILVAHLSYDRQQQCGNAADIIKYIEGHHLKNVILMGDFNTYADYEWPLQILTGSATDLKNRCPSFTKQLHVLGTKDTSLMDGWRAVHPSDQGLTFSNMPVPGKESRPDRILICERFRPLKAQLIGDGNTYKEKFYYHIWWNRFESVLAAMLSAHQGASGRSCQHDCGPHASCRCGVCVSGGDGHACTLPDCEECSPMMFTWLILLSGIFLLLVGQLIHAMLRVMHAMNRDTQERISGFMGAHCCLCNPKLYTPLPNPRRRHLFCRILYCRRLPPMLLVIMTVLALFFTAEILLLVFDDAINDINAIIPEELFPSDHLMLHIHISKNQRQIFR